MNAITETPTQVYRIYIKATPERIWEAMTKPQFTSRYLGGVVEVENGRWWERAPDGSLWHDDLIIESDPPRRLVHEWRSLRARELAEEEPSRVTWELEP
jgi:uncharacterized protein YndB with AHSA1/START domain